jgi:N-acyl-D-amino-acid deacylase
MLSPDHSSVKLVSDRGPLASGLRADVNLIDVYRLRLHPNWSTTCRPAVAGSGSGVDGYDATLVSGTPVFERGETPGRLFGGFSRNASTKRLSHASSLGS